MADPALCAVIDRLESAQTAAATRQSLAIDYFIRDEDDRRLWRHSVNLAGEPHPKLVVPEAGRGPLLRRFHHACHRGADVLFKEVSENYYWDNMVIT